mmetsp:Transcript_5471/g.9487  ORF Transcript_5471/g.9487 Transcript_5471/m.9487 type:complete len:583 (+) Transcript_5471:685-2433(+)
MPAGDLRDQVGGVLGLHLLAARGLLLLLPPDLRLDVLTDRELARPLADLSEIGAAEAVGDAGQVGEVHVLGDGGLAEGGLEDVEAGALVGERDVDQLVQATRAHDRRVDDVWPVRRTNDEHVLLGADTVHLGKNLVDDTVASAASIARAAASSAGDRVELIEEQHAGGRTARLVEKLADVGLGLTEPHGEELGALDRDEVGLALVGDGLGEQGFTAPRRSVEQHALRRLHPELGELLRVLHGVLHRLLQLALDIVQAADVVPRHVRHLHHRLAQRRWVRRAKSSLEVIHGDGHGVEKVDVDVLLEVDDVHLLSDALQCRFRAQGGDVAADVPMSLLGDLLEVHVLRQPHVLGVDAQNLKATVLVGDTDVELSVKAAEAAKRGVDAVGPVRGADDDYVGAGLQPVHQRQQLRHDAALHLPLRLLSLWGDGIDFIDENDGWRVLLGFLEGLAEIALRLPGELRHDLGPVDKEEEGAGFVGDRTGNQSFTRSGRPVEKDTFWWLNSDAFEELRMPERQLYQLTNLCQLLPYSSNVVVAHIIEALLVFAFDRLPFAVDNGVRCNDAILGRVRLNHFEFDRTHTSSH